MSSFPLPCPHQCHLGIPAHSYAWPLKIRGWEDRLVSAIKTRKTHQPRESCCVLSTITWLQNDLQHDRSSHWGDVSLGEGESKDLERDTHSRKSQSTPTYSTRQTMEHGSSPTKPQWRRPADGQSETCYSSPSNSSSSGLWG